VDDGKSTLIGRLLHDTKLILDDQLAALERDSRKHGTTGEDIDLRAAGRRARGRARAGHYDRCRLPLLQHAERRSFIVATRPATSSTPATWRPAPRTAMRDHADRRAQGRADADAPP
jgi:hypothetical protein